ncbi:MAG: hypothetical protein QMC78_01250 [Methanocellales archaeon]|nr:hypothetical protein [Methanocellales archaeon]
MLNMQKPKLTQKDKWNLLIDYEKKKLDVALYRENLTHNVALTGIILLLTLLLVVGEVIPEHVKTLYAIFGAISIVIVILYLLDTRRINKRIRSISRNLDEIYNNLLNSEKHQL